MDLSYLLAGVAIVIFVGFLILSIIFLSEGSKRASLRAVLLALTLPLPFLISSISESAVLHMVLSIVTFVTIACVILLLLPLKGKELKYNFDNKAVKDERDIMFSRKDLKPGTPLYDDYYRKHPEKELKDNRWRSEPGLLSPGSTFYNRLAFAAADASFEAVKLFSILRDSKPARSKSDISGTDVSGFIRAWSEKLGAVGVGFTEMKDYHYYTIHGRRGKYGNPVLMEHPYGIVFLVEMDEEMISSAPRSPVVMESANQYLRSAAIATQVAVMIRKLGYSARTHIDANYDVICPLVARDAGLGEIGRHGLLISDKFGPRVRISIVTTDLPLQICQPQSQSSVINFCSVCKKCAVNCPAQSIPEDAMEEIDGVMKWQLNQESCFTYWNHCGTDCGRCISTCPYSHRNTLIHNLVRKGIKHNVYFLHLARILDDFFYGRRPSPSTINDLIP